MLLFRVGPKIILFWGLHIGLHWNSRAFEGFEDSFDKIVIVLITEFLRHNETEVPEADKSVDLVFTEDLHNLKEIQ